MIRPLLIGAASLLISGCTTANAHAVHDYPEAERYEASADATADVDAALARAAVSGKRVLLILGANWCHDSRALAGWLESEGIAPLVQDQYELVFVDVGHPQADDARNMDIARRFGLNELPGTPNLLALTADGILLNAESATGWRNAASRSEGEIREELARLAAIPA